MKMTDSFDRHIYVLRNFVAAIRGEEPLFVYGKEGINSVTLMNAMLLSSWLDREIELPFDEELYFAELQKRAQKSGKKHFCAAGIEDNTCSFGGF